MWPWSPSSSRNDVQDYPPCIWEGLRLACMCAKSLQSYPTLCDPMDWLWPTRLLCPWDSPGKNTGVGCHALLQGFEACLLTNRTGRSNIVLLLRFVQKRWCNSKLASWNICPGTLSYPISLHLPWIHHASKMTKPDQTKRACTKTSHPQLLQSPIVSAFSSLWLQLHETP